MIIRRAEERDIPEIHRLLRQVLEVHAAIRPDIFIPGTVKYTNEELKGMLGDEEKPVFAAVSEDGAFLGYAFCALQKQAFSNTMIPFTALFVDDLCVDEQARGKGVGTALFAFLKEEAKRLGCREITLNVWEGNDPAMAFYVRQGMKPQETRMELIL